MAWVRSMSSTWRAARSGTLLTGAPGEYFYVPRWAPSGDAVVVEVDAFVTPRLDESVTDGATVAVFDLRDEVPVLSDLLPRERRASYPDWSPNGDTIVFQMPAVPDHRRVRRTSISSTHRARA